jgi:hypothetical protein
MFKRSILFLLLAVAAISLIRSTVGQGTDFLVFWKAGRALIDGTEIYNLAQDGGMVFKYPPWIAPFFIPVGLFSFEVAKWIWGIFCVASMGGIFWLLEKRFFISKTVWVTLAVLYWGLWVIHALDGQIILPLLVLGLYVMTAVRENSVVTSLLPITFSAKIFTVYPLLFSMKRFLKVKTILCGVFIVVFLSVITAMRSFHGDVIQMFHSWFEAAASGGQYLDAGQTRGPKNQSITSLICRWMQIPSIDTRAEVSVALSLFAIAFYGIRKRVKGLNDSEWFLVGLVLAPVFHPLPWHHLYVWTFPLACVATQAWVIDRKQSTWLASAGLFISIALITLSSERAFGLVGALRPIGAFLEWNVGRAWGALLLVIVYTQTRNKISQTA